MARGPQEQPASAIPAGMEPWETTYVRICIALYHDRQLELIYSSLNIPPARIGNVKTPRDVLNYLETFESYRALLAPDYFVTFPETLPMMWPVFKDRPLPEGHTWNQLDDQLWDRTIVEEFLAETERPEDRIAYLFYVISQETMNAEAIDAVMAEAARMESDFESGDAAEE